MLTRKVAHGHVPGCRGRASATPARASVPTAPPAMTAAASLTPPQATAVEVPALVGTVGQLAAPQEHVSPPETVDTAARDSAAGSSPIRILLVEDDDGDALLVEELFAVSGAHDRARARA